MKPWWMKFYVRNRIEGDGDDAGGGGSGDDGGDGGDAGGLGAQGDAADGDGGAGDAGSAAAGGGDGGGRDADERKTGADLTEGMRAAIEQGLGQGGNAGTDGAAAGSAAGKGAADRGSDPGKAAADDAAGKAVASAPGKEPGTAGAEGAEKKPAKADDFQLSAEDKRNLSPRAIGRFHELHKHAKAVEAEVERYRVENQTLDQARGAILKVLEDSHTTQEDLAELLNLNYMVKTGNIDGALQFVDSIRTTLLKHAGREAPGYDPIAEHGDLKKMVDDGDMTRAAALEVVRARNVTAQQERQRQEIEARTRSSTQAQRVQEKALSDIEAWNRTMAQTDQAFSQKAAILEPKLKGLMSRYPPALWPQVIQDAYDAIVITSPPSSPHQAAGTGGGSRPSGDGTLRPRGGGRPAGPAPGSMLEAIKQGLGH